MRALAGRGYWLPQQRIAEITRLAFIGDSYVFGQAVGFDETLPARTERHLNEINDAAPVEAVNLGICGYNFWNAWLAFKQAPQVYDGVVLVLCCNDAQLFGRTYNADYAGETTSLWLTDSALHPVLESGFDDIARFTKETGTKAAVCYFNVMGNRPYAEQRWSARIADAIASRCSARNIPFVDMHAHFVERSLPADTSVVSEADFHPSAAAHDAAARHLAGRLRELEWLKEGSGDTANAITPTTNAMIAGDSYPPDAAFRWADGAVAAKLQAARRQEALTGTDGIAAPIAKALEHNAETSARWHRGAQISALWQRAVSLEEGVAIHLSQIDEQMLRLDEVAFAAGTDKKLLALVRTQPFGDPIDMAAAVSRWRDQLGEIASSLSDECVRLADFPTTLDALADTDDGRRFTGDAHDLAGIASRLQGKLTEFVRTLSRLEPVLLSDPLREAPDVLARIVADIEGALRGAAIAREKLSPKGAYASWTTVHVEVRASAAIEGRQPCALEVQTNSTAPSRLPLLQRQNFLANGEAWRIAFAFPAFYGGRVFVQARMPDALAASVEPEFGDLEIVNGTVRRVVARKTLARDEAGRLVSPPIYVL